MTPGAGAPPAPRPAVRAVAVGLAAPLAAGAASVLGFAPFSFWPAPIVGLAVLAWAWTRSLTARQAALSGFAFGLGYFLVGVSWVFVSLHRYGGMPSVLAALATFLFCAYLALFPAIAGALCVRLSRTSASRLAMMPAAIAAAEWLRGTLFTGFPWLNLGTSQVPSSPLAALAPYGGAYGVTLAVGGAGALLAGTILARGRKGRGFAAAGLAALLLLPLGLARIEWTQPAGAPVSVALLQGNVAQDIKWEEAVRTRTLLDYRRMIFEAKARIVITPETALPAFLDQLPEDYVRSLRDHAREARKDILLGTVEREPEGASDRYYNSLVRIDAGPPQAYRKRHLVPFGEFIPPGFRWVLSILHIPMSDFSSGGEAQPPLSAASIPFGVAICYEDIFGEEVAGAAREAQALVNVSNDAWFGDSFAADQHLQASQMRALETGRWMVRATNTGASAFIDASGRVLSRLPPFTAGTLVGDIVPRTGLTPYVRFGNGPALLAMALLAFLAWRRGRGDR